MAQRKAPDLGPHPSAAPSDGDTPRVVIKLATGQFNRVIKLVRDADASAVLSLRHATFHTLRRLGVARDLTKAVPNAASGSDQVNVGSIIGWLAKVQPQHKRAIRQVIAIDATAVARTG